MRLLQKLWNKVMRAEKDTGCRIRKDVQRDFKGKINKREESLRYRDGSYHFIVFMMLFSVTVSLFPYTLAICMHVL